MLGNHNQTILARRRINDDMGMYVAENCVKKLAAADKNVKRAKVALLGFTFKENCPDTRNTMVIFMVNELKEYGIEPIIANPLADAEEAERLYVIEFVDVSKIKKTDAVILSVAHDDFKRDLSLKRMNSLFGEDKGVLLDIKGVYNRKECESVGVSYWRL